jgi:hypothetical protein
MFVMHVLLITFTGRVGLMARKESHTTSGKLSLYYRWYKFIIFRAKFFFIPCGGRSPTTTAGSDMITPGMCKNFALPYEKTIVL